VVFLKSQFFGHDEVTGVRCKARIDYLRHDAFNDLKTFSNAQRKTIDACVSSAIAYEIYNIQAVFYDEGLQTIKKMLVSDSPNTAEVCSDVDLNNGDFANFIKSLINNNQDFTFIFQESGQVNNCVARKIRQKD